MHRATGPTDYRGPATRMRRISATESAAIALTTTYALLTVASFPTTRAYLGSIDLRLTSVVTAASVTWYVSADADGNQPLTAVQTDTIVSGTAGNGGVARVLDFPLRTTTGSLYVWAKTNAGTATGVAAVAYEE